MIKKYSLLLIAFLCFVVSGFGQTWTYDFGTTTATHPASSISTTFFSGTPVNGGTYRVRTGTGSGTIVLANPGTTLGTASELQIQSATATSTNKFGVYDWATPSTVAYVKTKIRTTSATTGNLNFSLGLNTVGNDSQGYTSHYNNSVASFTIAYTGGAISSVIRRQTGGTNQAIAGSGFAKNTDQAIEVYANNGSTSTIYTVGATTYTLNSQQWDLWVGGVKISPANGWPKAGTLPVNSDISGFGFFAESSTSNSAYIYLDDLEYSNTLPASTNFVDYCNLQTPSAGNTIVGTVFNVYARVYEAGVTDPAGADPSISGWIGYSTTNTNPNTWTNWLPATFNAQFGNDDEYVANIGTLPSGTYYYASRFQISGGPYRYGGYNAGGGGYWDGATNVSGVLSIDTPDFVNLQFPGVGSINLGDPFAVYGQVYEQGVTPGAGQGAGIIAEIGFSPVNTNSNPNTWPAGNWISGAYNTACSDCNSGQNDEYSANLGAVIPTAGTYYYATRFRLNGGIWLYGGILSDGSAGNLWDGSTYISGVLTVVAPEINVEGNLGTFPDITNGDSTPSGTDNTLFAAQFIGASQSKSYRINNEGTANLTISGVTIGGLNPGDFTVTITPAATISPSTYSLLEITFSPLAAGVRTAIVSIANNDSDENPFTFTIQGTGNCVSSSTTISPSSGPVGTIITVTGTDFGGGTTAQISGTNAVVTILSSTVIEVTVPSGATTGNLVVVNNLGCSSSNSFNVTNNQIAGCEGSSNLTDLIISEITDATVGGVSYIEIYNGTGAAVLLGGYSIGIYANGDATASGNVNLNNVSLANNSTYVLAVGVAGTPTTSNTCSITGGNGQLANQTSGIGGINKKDNEHDVIRLLKSSGTVVVDEFGVYMDNDWMDSTIITGDRGFNFRRLNTASPLPNPTFNINDWNVIDWVGSGAGSCSTNDYSDIGLFDFSTGVPPTVTLQPVAPISNCDLTATLTVAGAEGVPSGFALAYQWYYAAPGDTGWTAVTNGALYSGATSTSLNILNTLNLDAYQYYCQVREDGATCYKASNAVRLTVQKAVWTGTWSSPPAIGKIVVIDADYITDATNGSFSACQLLVNTTRTLTIANTYYVEVENDVINDGTIEVLTGGSFVQNQNGAAAGSFTNNGTAIVKKRTANFFNDGFNLHYTYWSSPVNDPSNPSGNPDVPALAQDIAVLFPNPAGNRRFYYKAENFIDTYAESGNNNAAVAGQDDIDDDYNDWQVATGAMEVGRGYAVTATSPPLVPTPFPYNNEANFSGTFNTGDITVKLFKNNNEVADNNWNFIGNPYPSALSVDDFFDANVTNFPVSPPANPAEGAIFLWSQKNAPSTANNGNEGYNFSQSDYALINRVTQTAGASGVTPLRYIPSGQGFFVAYKENLGANVNSITKGDILFTNSMRRTSDNTQFFRGTSPSEQNRETSETAILWVNLSSDNGVFNQIAVAYAADATDGDDGWSYDTPRNLSSGTHSELYSLIPSQSKRFSIQAKNAHSLDLNEVIPLGFSTSINVATLYKITLANIEGDFFSQNTVYLKDHLLNTHHNLSQSDYSFTSAAGEFNDRFEIVFQTPEALSISDQEITPNGLTIIELNDGRVKFSVTNGLTIKTVAIIDVLGRTLYRLKGTDSIEIYTLSNLSQAAYIAKVGLSNGQTITKRAIKQQ